MAASGRTWEDISDEVAQTAESVGQSVVALQPKEGHASSGVIWQDKLIVTANHAASGEEVAVRLADGKSALARIKGRDPGTDLAIFSLEGDGGTVAKAGDASRLRVGNVVLALARTRRGNLTASSGIISGLLEEWQTWQGGRIDRFIRPDLTMYRGYSGGPLVNASGEVLGINTSGLRRGTPITLPSSTVARIVGELLAKGHVERPYLGVAVQPVVVPEEMGTKLNLGSRHALLLVHVESGGPAASAGLMLGDIVIEIEGKPIAQSGFRGLLSKARVGERLLLGIVRSGEKREVSVILGDRLGQ